METSTMAARLAWVLVGLTIPASILAQDTTSIATNRALRVLRLSPNQVLLTAPDAADRLADRVADQVVDPGRFQTLSAGQAILSRSSDTARSVSLPAEIAGSAVLPANEGPRKVLQLPWEYQVRRVSGTGSEPVIHAQPVTWADGPLTFNRDARRFEGSVSLFLQNSVRPAGRDEVVPPFPIILTSDADSLDRNVIDLGWTGFPPEIIRVTSRHPGDSVRIDIRTPSDAVGVPLHVPVRPTVVIESPRRTVPGWGVGEFRVTVELHGPLPGGDVRLRPSIQGVVDSSGVHMAGGRTTQLTIRSQGLGIVPLTVAADGFVSDQVPFEYVFPFWFFGMGAAGAILGAAFAVSRTQKERRWLFFLNRVGLGLAGMLAYFVLGVQIFAIDKSPVPISEIAVLTVALLAALVAPDFLGIGGGRDRHAAEAS
jgi:hypothetical protein